MMVEKFLTLIVLLLFSQLTGAQQFPDKSWFKYQNIEEAGFSLEKLEDAKQFFNSINGGAALVVYKGAVVVDWGENTRRFMVASMRKSLLNALIGRAVEENKLNLNESLGELGIDDITSLTENEKSAKVKDMLSSQSGIYIPAAFEDKHWKERKPVRGSHAPGTFWYYNNWDFNVLGAIYEKATGKKIFEAFEEEIAKVIGMEDYRLFDGVYLFETETKYPAYLFKMSSRDLARFGLLYLKHGIWNGISVVPKQWISLSTQPHAKLENDSYGYLWWINSIANHTVYTAKGSGLQALYVIPESDMLIVLRANNYTGKSISDSEGETFVKKILESHIGLEPSSPSLEPIEWFENVKPVLSEKFSIDESFIGEYIHPQFGKFKIEFYESRLTLSTKPGRFKVFINENNEYFIEDLNVTAKFIKTNVENKKGKCEIIKNPEAKFPELVFYY